jgi:hypothetical protein
MRSKPKKVFSKARPFVISAEQPKTERARKVLAMTRGKAYLGTTPRRRWIGAQEGGRFFWRDCVWLTRVALGRTL